MVTASVNAADTNPEPTATPASMQVGEIGVLRSNSGGKGVFLCANKQAYDEYWNALLANDDEGLVELMLDGKLVPIDNGTPVRKLSYGGLFDHTCEVRLMKGKFAGKRGIVSLDWLVAK